MSRSVIGSASRVPQEEAAFRHLSDHCTILCTMRELRCWLFGLITSVLLLAAVRALAFKQPRIRQLDSEALLRLSERRWETQRGSAAAVLVHLGDPLVVLGLAVAICGLALHWRGPAYALAAGALIFAASLATQVLKHTASPPRFHPLLGFDQIGETAFPSGHTTAAASLALALVLVAPRRWRPPALFGGSLLVLCVGLAVVIRHWHYPSDAIGGVLVATAWFCVVGGVLAAGRKAPGS